MGDTSGIRSYLVGASGQATRLRDAIERASRAAPEHPAWPELMGSDRALFVVRSDEDPPQSVYLALSAAGIEMIEPVGGAPVPTIEFSASPAVWERVIDGVAEPIEQMTHGEILLDCRTVDLARFQGPLTMFFQALPVVA